ncbi:unnamed protein product [Linum tenue]|uniref:CREG-like beta-barrel domain-containing protein n=1 Tax=Linum tenue TaxID=586396 RepID=A0AAV0M7H3_9ROSI|nr:unnamed protein product [Linum tenue]
MESLSSSAFVSRFPETHPSLSPPSPSSSSSSSSACCYSSSSKILLSKGIIGSPKFAEAARFPRLRLQGLARELSGGAGEENSHLGDDGFGLVSDATLSLPQGLIKQAESSQKDSEKLLKVESPLTVPHGSGTSGGTRAGLFRTPISGGVQSATSAHGLPRPALAVRNLMEQARFAHLCTTMSRMHHRREGYPFGSLVDFAPDAMGHPIFSFSPLAIHTRNLLADPKCTLVVQIPGWSSLSNARVTIFGDVYPLAEDEQEWAHKQYIAKHQQGPSQQWGNFYYFRMQNISDIYFIGGFGTVAWVDVKEYEALQPDKIAVDGGEHNLKVMLIALSCSATHLTTYACQLPLIHMFHNGNE